MSTIKVNELDTRSGTTITVAAGKTIAGTDIIDTTQIKDDAVTADKLANSINTEIAANTAKVTNATHTGDVTGATALTIATDAVVTAKILDNNVTLAKLDDGTQGDILYYGAAGAPTRLAKGTADQVLKINSGATAPEWGTDSGGGLKLLSDNDFVGTASHFDVTDCFSATYRSYLIVMDVICVQTETAHLFLKLGNSNLSSTENASWQLQMLGTNGTTDYKAVGNGDAGGQRLVHQQHNSNMGFSGHLWVHNPYGSGAGYICYTHGTGEVYANGTAEGFWFTRYGASHGVNSIVSMRLTASGGMGYSGITGHVLIYGLSES